MIQRVGAAGGFPAGEAAPAVGHGSLVSIRRAIDVRSYR